MNEEDKLVLGTLAGVDLILSPEHYEEYKGTLNKQIKTLQQELDQYKNNWEELKKWLEEQHQFIIEIPAFTKEIIQEHKTMKLCYEDILNKMKELEEGK